jgi:hypothetical protein
MLLGNFPNSENAYEITRTMWFAQNWLRNGSLVFLFQPQGETGVLENSQKAIQVRKTFQNTYFFSN